ncbi:MAG: helix-turn-helix domain-containing protein [Rothia sp. (in: high G+C Gram-positive bacteria)]|nr:helix-turn-helix domain-containing protein [Rothia sp. (in: high G+C Gram-positive bacteria)]
MKQKYISERLMVGIAEEIGETIRVSRRAYNLTQQQLADLTGLSDRTVRDIEKGKPGPSLANVLALTEALGIKLTVETTV